LSSGCAMCTLEGCAALAQGFSIPKKAACWVAPNDPPSCPKGHVMIAVSENPSGYRNTACCDICGLPNLPVLRTYFFHCGACKFDECPECAAPIFRFHLRVGKIVEVMQDTSAIVAVNTRPKSYGQLPTFAWRVWSAAPVIARYLETRHQVPETRKPHDTKRPLAIELGAGAGLASLVLAQSSSHDVLITDLREALALARDGVRRNVLDPAAADATVAAAAPHCPGHHGELSDDAIAAVEAVDDSRTCAVCARDAVSLSRCRACDFLLCSACIKQVKDGDIHGLPRWFQVQCQQAPTGKPLVGSRIGNSPTVRVRSLNWACRDDLTKLREEATAVGLPSPSLVIASDVAYDKELVNHFLETLEHLRDWIRSEKGEGARAELLIGQEMRGTVVDSRFLKGLRARGIHTQKVSSEDVELEGGGLVGVWTAEL